MSGERGCAYRDSGTMGELPGWGEVQRWTRRAGRFPAGVFHCRLGGDHAQEKCRRKGGQWHDIAVVLELVRALLDSRACIIRAARRLRVGDTMQEFEAGEFLEEAMRRHRRPKQGEHGRQDCAQVRHA